METVTTTSTVGESPRPGEISASHASPPLTPVSHRRRALSHGSSSMRRGGGADHRAREFRHVVEPVKGAAKAGHICSRDVGLAKIRFRKPVE